jgi:hypothetical protein
MDACVFSKYFCSWCVSHLADRFFKNHCVLKLNGGRHPIVECALILL